MAGSLRRRSPSCTTRVLSRFSRSDEGGAAWFAKRLNPTLPQPAAGRRIWIHAVSAGESEGRRVAPAQRLLEHDPTLSVRSLGYHLFRLHPRPRIAGDAVELHHAARYA